MTKQQHDEAIRRLKKCVKIGNELRELRKARERELRVTAQKLGL